MNLIACPIFDSLSSSSMSLVKEQASTFSVSAGTRLFETTNECQMMPIVTSGTIRVFSQSDTGREITLYRVSPEQLCILTISCLLSGDRYPASSIAETEVSGISVPKSLFLELMASEPSFSAQIFHTFSYRITHLMQLVDAVAFKKLDKRLAYYLLEQGPVITCSHQKIADELGSVREIISRLLKQFEDKGIVALSRKQIQLIDPDQLRLFVD
ncbi:Crp/Fnr family transcriptional regulator [Thalassotalea montiporae]